MKGKLLNIIEDFVYHEEKDSAMEIKEIYINLNPALKQKLHKEISEEQMYFSTYTLSPILDILSIKLRGVDIIINDSRNKNIHYTNKFHEFLYDKLNG